MIHGQFTPQRPVKRLRLASGDQLRASEVPLVALGRVEEMSISYGPGPMGEIPWVLIVPGEDHPTYLVNLSTVQEIELADG